MKLIAVVLLLITSSLVQAEMTTPVAAAQNNCASDSEKFCSAVPGDKSRCLIEHRSDLSMACRQDLERLVRTRDQAGERGGGALAALGGFNYLMPPIPVFSYDGRLNLQAPAYTENKVSLSSPVYHTESDMVGGSLSAAKFQTVNAVDMGNGTIVPSELYRAEVGAQYTHQLTGRRNWGLRGSYGFAGDRAFDSTQDATFSLSAQYGYPSESGQYWMLTAFLSSNSQFGAYIPLVGFLYFYKTPTFTGVFGFPIISLQWTPQWTPRDQFAYSLTAFGTTVNAEAAYGELRTAQYFFNARWTNQNFTLSNRIDDRDRLTFEEKKLAIGARAFAFGMMRVELQGGYSFDRIFYIGNGVRNMRDGSKHVDASPFAAVSLKAIL